MITLGLTQGQRGRRAVEVVLGVTLGIAVADLLVIVLGTGWWQLALVVALAMSAALLLGSGHMFAQQAAVSAALVATLQPPDDGVSFARAVDALIGGGVALAVSALVLPAHPARMVRDAAAPVLRRARRRARGRRPRARRPRPAAVQAALDRGRAIDELARELDEALVVGRETARLAPPRRRTLETVDLYADAAAPDRPRGPQRPRARPRRPPRDRPRGERPAGGRATRCARSPTAVRALGEALDDPPHADAVREPALRAAGKATLVLESTGNLSVSVIVGQVRSTAVDLLRGSGMSFEEAAEAVRAAAARSGGLSRTRAAGRPATVAAWAGSCCGGASSWWSTAAVAVSLTFLFFQYTIEGVTAPADLLAALGRVVRAPRAAPRPGRELPRQRGARLPRAPRGARGRTSTLLIGGTLAALAWALPLGAWAGAHPRSRVRARSTPVPRPSSSVYWLGFVVLILFANDSGRIVQLSFVSGQGDYADLGGNPLDWGRAVWVPILVVGAPLGAQLLA